MSVRSLSVLLTGMAMGVSVAMAGHAGPATSEPTLVQVHSTMATHHRVAAPQWAPAEYPPCEQEDSHSCYWDAGVAGNGHGCSFWSDAADRVHYITRACRDL